MKPWRPRTPRGRGPPSPPSSPAALELDSAPSYGLGEATHQGRTFSMDDQDLVLGVNIDGDSRAYHVGTMNGREIVNDEVGGVPILVSW